MTDLSAIPSSVSPSPESLTIALRAFVTDLQAKPDNPRKPWQSPLSEWTLIFDTETTTIPRSGSVLAAINCAKAKRSTKRACSTIRTC